MSTLELRDLTKTFGGVHAVEGASLWCDAGTITALIGPNGAGKTTIFNLICGFLRPDGGSIRYGGRELSGLPPWRVARLGVGRLFQDVRLFAQLTVLENVLVAFPKEALEGVLHAVFLRRRVLATERRLARRALEILDSVGLADRADDRAERLSFGQQKLVAIARLLAVDAQLVLLDEPTAGIAPHMTAQLVGAIRELSSQGKGVLVIEHDMNVVGQVADWVFFLEQGRVTAAGPPGRILRDGRVRAAYLGRRVAERYDAAG